MPPLIKYKLKAILLHDRMLMTRLGLACGSMLWALQLALPVQLFPTAEQLASGAGRTTYSIMATIAPENVWAALFFFHSLFAFYTLFSGVRNTVTLAMDGFLGCLLWTSSTLACYGAHWPHHLPFLDALGLYRPPAAMSGEAIMAVYAWWHMVRFWAEEETHKSCKISGTTIPGDETWRQ